MKPDLSVVLLWTILAAPVVIVLVMWYQTRGTLRRRQAPRAEPARGGEDATGDPHVYFLRREDTARFLKSDPDGYVAAMSPLDLYARSVSTGAEYTERAAGAAGDFTVAERVRVTLAAQEADRFLERHCSLLLDGGRLAGMPWILALTRGGVYEEGMPHTRTNTIFLSDAALKRDLVRTLIHEKVHVYQRAYPEEMAQILERRGFRRWKMRMGEPRVRANPDLDPYIYIDPRTREPMVARYTTDRPSSIQDVELSHAAFEHPLESIAYEIAGKY